MNGHIEEINKSKYLILIPKKSKEIIKKYKKMWNKIRDLIRLITKTLDDYDEECENVKIKFNLDDYLPLNKTTEIHNTTKVARAVFYEYNKYYVHVFLDECLQET